MVILEEMFLFIEKSEDKAKDKINIFVLEYLENIENKIKALKISILNQENLY